VEAASIGGLFHCKSLSWGKDAMSLLPTLALLLAGGAVTGLLLQWLAVLTGVQSGDRRNFINTGLIGALGAVGGIPLSALLDYARGGPGELSGELIFSAAITTAIALSSSWIMLPNLKRAPVQRALVAVAIVSTMLAVLIVIALTLYIES
jgi:hypothetical protein